MPQELSESEVQLKVVEWARANGLKSRKLSWGEGWPDYIFLYRGQCCFIEFKKIGEHLRPLQKFMVSQLRMDDFSVGVVDKVDQGIDMLGKWKHGIDFSRKVSDRR
jgi:hypothetical protein